MELNVSAIGYELEKKKVKENSAIIEHFVIYNNKLYVRYSDDPRYIYTANISDDDLPLISYNKYMYNRYFFNGREFDYEIIDDVYLLSADLKPLKKAILYKKVFVDIEDLIVCRNKDLYLYRSSTNTSTKIGEMVNPFGIVLQPKYSQVFSAGNVILSKTFMISEKKNIKKLSFVILSERELSSKTLLRGEI